MSLVRNAISTALLGACLAQSALAQLAPTPGPQPTVPSPGSVSSAADPSQQARQTLEQMALAAQQAQQAAKSAPVPSSSAAAMPAELPPPVATPYVLGATPTPMPMPFGPSVATAPPVAPQLRALAGKPGAYFAEIADNGFVYKVAVGQHVGSTDWVLQSLDMDRGIAHLQSDKPATHRRKPAGPQQRTSLTLSLARPDGANTGFAGTTSTAFPSR